MTGPDNVGAGGAAKATSATKELLLLERAVRGQWLAGPIPAVKKTKSRRDFANEHSRETCLGAAWVSR